MNVGLIKILSLSLCLHLVAMADVSSALFPVKNPYKASVLSILPAGKYKEKVHKLQANGVVLNVRLQLLKDAPLIFIVPGLGGATDSSLSEIVAHQAFISGYHTVNLISPIHPDFVSEISESGFVGNFFYDTKDLVKLMKATVHELSDRANPRFYSIVGFSLGGSLVPLIEMEERKQPYFNFKQIVLLNPGASISFAVDTIDELYNVKVGTPNVVKLSENFVKRQIGASFRKSLTAVIAETMLISKRGYSTNMDFETYLNTVIRGLTTEKDVGLANQEARFSDNFDFKNYIDIFKQDQRFIVFHNRNDFLLRPEDIKFYQNNFGDRFKLFSYGGHCGNFWFPQYQKYFRQILRSVY